MKNQPQISRSIHEIKRKINSQRKENRYTKRKYKDKFDLIDIEDRNTLNRLSPINQIHQILLWIQLLSC